MKSLKDYIKPVEPLKERYSDYSEGEVEYTKFKIVVDSEQDKKRLQEAFSHIHFSDTDIIGVNEENSNIIVDSELYKQIITDE